jgi:predicted RNA-binding Zn-ribbon protein involved in translation (DUF1610 family)
MAPAVYVATVHEMDDRHYVCEQCGLKWFVPASRAGDPGELHCGECGAVLTPREQWLADEFPTVDQSVRA